VPSVPEVEVRADDDALGGQALDEDRLDELLGGLVAARRVEGEHRRRVEVAGGGEQLELLLEGREHARRRLRPDHLGRVAVEGEAHRGLPVRRGALADEAQHGLMTEVDPVVGADRDDRAPPVGLVAREVGDDLHHAAASGRATTTVGL